MVKVGSRDIPAKIKDIGQGISAVLLYGPDQGRALSYAKQIAKQIVEDLEDPFLVSRPVGADVKENPGLLLDEIDAVPMLGGRKLVRYDFRGSGNEVPAQVTEPLKLVLEGAKGDGLLIITAGDVKGTSALVKLAEKAPNALAIACYQDDAKDVAQIIADKFQRAGLSINPDADQFLRAHLGGDRAITLSELDKIILYKGGDKSPVTLTEVETLIGDSSQMMLADIAAAVTAGDIATLEDRLAKAEISGEQPVAILRVVQIRIQRLYQVRAMMHQGAAQDAALKSLQPPVFWKDRDPFNRSLAKWSLPKLGRAVTLLFEAEVGLKTTGNPAQTLLARTLLQLTNAARRA